MIQLLSKESPVLDGAGLFLFAIVNDYSFRLVMA